MTDNRVHLSCSLGAKDFMNVQRERGVSDRSHVQLWGKARQAESG